MIVSGWVSMVTMISSFSCVTPEGQCSTPLRTAPPQPAQHTRPDCVMVEHNLLPVCVCVCVLLHVCVSSVAWQYFLEGLYLNDHKEPGVTGLQRTTKLFLGNEKVSFDYVFLYFSY